MKKKAVYLSKSFKSCAVSVIGICRADMNPEYFTEALGWCIIYISFQKLHCKIHVINITTCSMITHLTWITVSNLLVFFHLILDCQGFYFIFLKIQYYLSGDFSGWFQLKNNSRKTFDIAIPTKRTFSLNFNLRDTATLKTPTLLVHASCSVKWKM